MWELPKGEDFLPDINPTELKRLYAKETKAKPKLRLLCALHRKRGASIDEIARITTLPRRTVHGTLGRFAERGIAAKDSIKQSGKPPKLSLKQRKRLIRDLERGPPHNPSGLWSTKEVCELLRTKYHVSFWPQHAWRILKALGFSLQKPRKQHHKSASPEEVEAFKKTRENSQEDTESVALSWARRMRQPSA
jgi:transposase